MKNDFIAKSIQKELKYGEENEQDILSILKNLTGKDIKKLDKFNLFDFYYEDKENNKKIYIELKTRKNELLKFKTTMIGLNKIKKAKEFKKENINCLFIFKFVDDVKFIKYKKKKFNNYTNKNITRKDRNITNLYKMIDVEDLKDLKYISKYF